MNRLSCGCDTGSCETALPEVGAELVTTDDGVCGFVGELAKIRPPFWLSLPVECVIVDVTTAPLLPHLEAGPDVAEGSNCGRGLLDRLLRRKRTTAAATKRTVASTPMVMPAYTPADKPPAFLPPEGDPCVG